MILQDTHMYFMKPKLTREKKQVDPQVSLLKNEKRGSIGNLIQSQWYKVICAYVLEWINKKEKMKWFGGFTGYAFPKFLEYNKGTLMKHFCIVTI